MLFLYVFMIIAMLIIYHNYYIRGNHVCAFADMMPASCFDTNSQQRNFFEGILRRVSAIQCMAEVFHVYHEEGCMHVIMRRLFLKRKGFARLRCDKLSL